MFNVEVKLENIKQEADLVHDLLPRTKNIKERTSRRKSAVRAIEKLSSIVKFNSGIKKPKRLLSLQDDEEYGSTNTSTNTSNNTSDNDDEYKLPTNQRSSSENESDSEGEEDSSASYSDSDGGVSDSTSAYLFHKKTVRRGDLYDELFFEQWLEDHTPTDDLFKSLLPSKNNIIFLSESEYSKYLPKSGYSPDIEISYYSSFKQRKATETLSLKNFKAMPSLHGSTSVAFNVGGSIWGLDWCPVPSTDDQYLAVSAHSMYSKVHSLLNGSADSGLIQIWHIGKLNKEKKSCVQPRLSLCICHDYGPVYDIKWCPTGCYMKEDGRVIRLGLLAVACGDGKVRLYSIPSPDKFPQDDNVFVKLEPCLVLLPHKQDSIETIQTGACMSLSWQFTAKERKIAAGFADGCLRIWNPDTNSIFLKTDFNGNPAVLPIIQIDAHSFAVRSLSWCPYNSDLIATGSKDKTVKVFNIKEPCYPLFVFKRGFPLNIEWPIPRIGFFFTEDDCFNVTPTSARYMVLERLFKLVKDDKDTPHPTTRHNATVWSCSYNNYLDMMATCDIAGEVMVSKNQDVLGAKTPTILLKMEPVYHLERTWDEPNEIEATKTSIYQSHSDNVTQSDVDCINLLEDYKKYNTSEEDVYFKYKYKFCDSNRFEFTQHRLRNDPDNKRLEKVTSLQSSTMDHIETRSVQKVTWNQNYGCHTWLASGTKIGIVRLHNFKAWNE